MADEQAVTEEQQPQFSVQKVYLKDVSYESPNSPEFFAAANEWQPQVNLQLNTESREIAESVYEVVLTVTVTSNQEEKTAYLVEVKQAGIFTLDGFDEGSMGHLLGAYCPNILYPYARAEVSNLVVAGGFPQLLLEPVNFDALYAQHMEQRAADAAGSETLQ